MRPYQGFPDLCLAPCVALFPLPRETYTLESSQIERLSILAIREKILVAVESKGRNTRGFEETRGLISMLHFGTPGR